MSEMAAVERTFVANKTRLLELIEIAQTKMTEASVEKREDDRLYWAGVEFGLRRALGVIEGRG